MKPVVKITGEFWAQTTEGDGNFNMFRFLEREGAEVIVEPIGTWIMYMIHQFKQKLRDRKGIEDKAEMPAWTRDRRRLAVETRYRKRYTRMTIAERIFMREYDAPPGSAGRRHSARAGVPVRAAADGTSRTTTRARLAAKATSKWRRTSTTPARVSAHMVASLKPFGCMPSTQSDGAQAAVTEHYKDMIYLPIETSGEGEINAHSRTTDGAG